MHLPVNGIPEYPYWSVSLQTKRKRKINTLCFSIFNSTSSHYIPSKVSANYIPPATMQGYTWFLYLYFNQDYFLLSRFFPIRHLPFVYQL